MSEETIFALSTGGLPSGVAVVRLSGPRAIEVLEMFCGLPGNDRVMEYRTVRDPANGETIDKAMVCWFRSPASFTGEDCAEFHLHGSKPVVGRLLSALGNLPNMRLADAGEFSRRAFENGKLDLTAVEGLSDLLAAETEAQRRQALALADGVFRKKLEDWRARLLRARAFLEAEFDFSDEDDVPESMIDQVGATVRLLKGEIDLFLGGAARGMIVRDGLKVVLAGPPNAGKSSLMNRLAGEDIAIVSEEAGTTRDVIECRIDLGGHVVIVRDTAGIRKTDSGVEQEGIKRAIRSAASADIVFWLSPANDPVALHDELPSSACTVISKVDLVSDKVSGLTVSVKNDDGLDNLLSFIQGRLESMDLGSGLVTRERHRQELLAASGHLSDFESSVLGDRVLAAESLRLAGVHIGRLTGSIDVEELLDVIFSEFCIGK